MGRESRRHLLLWVVAAISYGLLSLAAFCASSLPSLRGVVWGWSFIWLFGPPVTLVHGLDGWAFYLVETILVGGLALRAIKRQTWLVAAALGGCALLVWLLSGFLAIAILI